MVDHQVLGQTLLLLGFLLTAGAVAILIRSGDGNGDVLIQPLPRRLERALRQSLRPNERVIAQLKGAFTQGLVCTDSRVLVLKGGWFCGQIFGTNTFQLPYASVAGCEVKFSLLTGWFEISSGGMQNQPRHFWSRAESTSPTRAPNCVSLLSLSQAKAFRHACTLILDMQGNAALHSSAATAQPTVADRLRALTQMRDDNLISAAEFETKKAQLLQQL